MSRHTFTILFSKQFGMDFEFGCDYDLADESRPCWPHTETGERYDAESGKRVGCVYDDWIGEMGFEAITSGPSVAFDLTGTWDGDHFAFHLAAPAPQPEPEQT